MLASHRRLGTLLSWWDAYLARGTPWLWSPGSVEHTCSTNTGKVKAGRLRVQVILGHTAGLKLDRAVGDSD